MTILSYIIIALAIAVTLSSRRIGMGHAQFWIIQALVAAAAVAGRLA